MALIDEVRKKGIEVQFMNNEVVNFATPPPIFPDKLAYVRCVRLSDLEEILSKAICENCRHSFDTEMNNNALVCEINETIDINVNGDFGCNHWGAKQ